MAGAAIAPQVVLATATLGGVLITAIAGELRGRRQEVRRAEERTEDQLRDERARFHSDRLAAVAELTSASSTVFLRLNLGGDADSEAEALLKALRDADNAAQRCLVLFPGPQREAVRKLMAVIAHADGGTESLSSIGQAQADLQASIREYFGIA